jgi:hypothetical protein
MSTNAMQMIPEQTLSGTTPSYTLFDSRAVGLATLFGTPAAGSSLMALNYRRLGQTSKGVLALALGFAITGLVILFAWHLPQGASFPIGLVLLIAMQRTAQWLQGPAVKEHVQRGGPLGSKWGAFGLGLVFLTVLSAVIYLAIHKPHVVIGSKDEVFYSGSATKADAQSLGDALKTHGFFSDSGASGHGAEVDLEKGKDGTAISFIVKDGSWDQPGVLSNFEEIGREVAPSVGGFPLRVRLTNTEHDVKKESTVGKAAFPGNVDIYYLGDASESEAKALAQALKSAGFFQGTGADVFLSKHSDGTVLSFVVGEAAWDDPAMVGDFEKLVRKAAPAVGGLPIRLRLVDNLLEAKKEEIVR